MKIVSLAFFSGVSLAGYVAWSNTSLTHFPPQTVTVPYTVTGYTTFCPSSTIFTITTCKHHVCAPTTVTVTEPTTVIFTDECKIKTTYVSVPRLHPTYSPPKPHFTKTKEYTVTGYTTYCPTPTTFTYTKYREGKRIPVVVTVTEATTVIETEPCIVWSTCTEEAESSTPTNVVYGTVTKTIKHTVTDYSTYCPTSTVLTITKVIDYKPTCTVITVTSPATVTVYGTCIVDSTVTEAIPLTASGGQLHAYTTNVYHSTVTELTTFCPEATVFIVTTCTTNKCAPHPITVTDATLLTITGTLVVDYTVTEEVTETTPPATVHSVATTVTEYTVTEYTTICPSPTTVHVKTCNEHECVPYAITVTEATTLSVPGTVVVIHTVTEEVTETAPTVSVITLATTITEYTVTEYTTICPSPTTVHVKTCNENECVPYAITVTEATTLSVPGTVVVSHTVTEEVTETPPPATVHAVATTVTEYTVTGYTTICPSPTIVHVKTCEENECVPYAITVTEATTLSVPGTVVVASTIISTETSVPVVNTVTTPTGVVIVSSTATSGGEIPGLYSIGASESSAGTSAPSITLVHGSAGRNIAGFAGILGFAALLV